MKRLIKWLFILVLLVVVVLGGLLASSIDKMALVPQRGELSKKELEHISWLIRRNSPLRKSSAGRSTGVLTQKELNLITAYLIQTRSGSYRNHLASEIDLQAGAAVINLSLRLPDNPIGHYLNLSAEVKTLGQMAPFLNLQGLQIGGRTLPQSVVRSVSSALYTYLADNSAEFRELEKSVRSVNIRKEKLIVGYSLSQESMNNMKAHLGSMVISSELKQALLIYSDYLAERSRDLPERLDMTDALRVMFHHAYRSHDDLSTVVENQAIFISLAAYTLDRSIPVLLGEKTGQTAVKRRLYLKGREDLSKHFLVSAAVASLANPALAEVIGLEKEIFDAQGGSGFSYADLAADQAGIRLAEHAISSELNATRLQIFLSGNLSESDIMPTLEAMPEGLQQEANNAEAVNKNSQTYKKLRALMMQRIDNLPVYKQL